MAFDKEAGHDSSDGPSSYRSTDVGSDGSAEPIVTLKTWIVCAILSCGHAFSFWPIPVLSAIGPSISTTLGSPESYVWFVPSWTISITAAFLICGPMTDMFGRRWFLVGGSLLCFVGHVIVASSKNNRQVIGGLAVSGVGAANCQMAAFALPELLPNKWRALGVVLSEMTTYVAVIVGPITGQYSVQWGVWYWNWYALAIFQGLSFVALLALYFPPKHPIGISYMEAFRSLDYLGAFLFIGGAVPFLMGVVWAQVYDSNDPHVVATLVVGAFVLILFGLWETFGNLKYPLTPPRVFSSSWGRDVTAPAVVVAIVNMFYYSASIIWPQLISVFYTPGHDWTYGVKLTLVQGLPIAFGAIMVGLCSSYIGRWQWQLTVSTLLMTLFGSLLGLATPTNKATMSVFLFLCQFTYAWAITISIAITQMGVDQKDLGISGGIAGTFRFAGGAIASSIYQTVYSTTLTKYTARYVPAAALSAGLPKSKLTGLLSALSQDPTGLSKSYGNAIATAATAALGQAYCKAIFTVAMCSMAFGIVGIFACLYCKNVDHKMTNKIEVYLENTRLAERNEYH